MNGNSIQSAGLLRVADNSEVFDVPVPIIIFDLY